MKRYTPPATFNTLPSAIQMNTKHEESFEQTQRLSKEIEVLQKIVEHKDSDIKSLKEVALDWKRKANEYKSFYEETLEEMHNQEKLLVKRHTAEIDILTKLHVEKMDKAIAKILSLEQKTTRSTVQDSLFLEIGSIEEACKAAEDASRAATESVLYTRQKADDLVLNINVSVIDTKVCN
ncbi:hypothetical protein BDF14DRAFT_1419024 [Spinellus fusiger]|nr:hypothetical protein BDF14DRAFT_1419024 [Spinellus fusiger]